MAKILVIEDNREINELIQLHLNRAGHEVIAKEHGIHIEDEAIETIDLFILDIMLPMISGFELIGVIRKRTWAPIIALTAMTSESERIRGLDLGADDYVCKPFSIAELISRINAQLRKVSQLTGQSGQRSELMCGNLKIDSDQHACFRGDEEIALNPIEFKLLRYFIQNKERVLNKAQIYEGVWNEPYFGDDNTIMVHMRRLREKIEPIPNVPIYLITVRGVGYKLTSGALSNGE